MGCSRNGGLGKVGYRLETGKKRRGKEKKSVKWDIVCTMYDKIYEID
jgi:hypothetical protein